MRRILGIAAICSVVIASGLYGQESARKIVTIHLGGRSQETLQSFYRAGYDITLFDRNAETANVLVNASEKRQLEELGFATETLLEDADAFAQQLRQQGYLENFHSYDRMLAELQDVAANFPAITQLALGWGILWKAAQWLLDSPIVQGQMHLQVDPQHLQAGAVLTHTVLE